MTLRRHRYVGVLTPLLVRQVERARWERENVLHTLAGEHYCVGCRNWHAGVGACTQFLFDGALVP